MRNDDTLDIEKPYGILAHTTKLIWLSFYNKRRFQPTFIIETIAINRARGEYPLQRVIPVRIKIRESKEKATPKRGLFLWLPLLDLNQ